MSGTRARGGTGGRRAHKDARSTWSGPLPRGLGGGGARPHRARPRLAAREMAPGSQIMAAGRVDRAGLGRRPAARSRFRSLASRPQPKAPSPQPVSKPEPFQVPEPLSLQPLQVSVPHPVPLAVHLQVQVCAKIQVQVVLGLQIPLAVQIQVEIQKPSARVQEGVQV